jgi:hypothetical protein
VRGATAARRRRLSQTRHVPPGKSAAAPSPAADAEDHMTVAKRGTGRRPPPPVLSTGARPGSIAALNVCDFESSLRLGCHVSPPPGDSTARRRRGGRRGLNKYSFTVQSLRPCRILQSRAEADSPGARRHGGPVRTALRSRCARRRRVAYSVRLDNVPEARVASRTALPLSGGAGSKNAAADDPYGRERPGVTAATAHGLKLPEQLVSLVHNPKRNVRPPLNIKVPRVPGPGGDKEP